MRRSTCSSDGRPAGRIDRADVYDDGSKPRRSRGAIGRGPVIDLKIDDDIVITTEDHPFWNATDVEWPQAQDVVIGDLVRTADGELVTVDGLELRSARRAAAFNLTVDRIHTYFVAVGEDEVLVHNVCDLGRGKWMTPGDFADDVIKATRDRYRNLPTETGQHDAGLGPAARDVREQARGAGYLEEIEARLLRIAASWDARARGIDHPHRR